MDGWGVVGAWVEERAASVAAGIAELPHAARDLVRWLDWILRPGAYYVGGPVAVLGSSPAQQLNHGCTRMVVIGTCPGLFEFFPPGLSAALRNRNQTWGPPARLVAS